MSDSKERKAARKAVQMQKLREKQMLDHPEWCYCEEVLHKEADIDWENDMPIGQIESVDGFPNWNSTGHTQDIYRCKRCGKQYCTPIAYAMPYVPKAEPVLDEEAKNKLIANIVKAATSIAENSVYGKANYATVPVSYVERVATELDITYEEACDRIREFFKQHVN